MRGGEAFTVDVLQLWLSHETISLRNFNSKTVDMNKHAEYKKDWFIYQQTNVEKTARLGGWKLDEIDHFYQT